METAIISGKGGTGKSSVSAAFATLSEAVVLADCDVDAANLYILFDPIHEEEEIFIGGQEALIDRALCTDCGICIPYCRFDAIYRNEQQVMISGTACDGCHLCKQICPERAITMVKHDRSRLFSGSFRNGRMVYGRLAPGEENSGKLVNLVRCKARREASVHGIQNILIDGPPGIGCPVISTITGTDKVVIVTEPTLAALHDLSRVVAMTADFTIPTVVILNKSDVNEGIASQIRGFCRQTGLVVLAELPFDPLMVEAMVQRKSIVEYAPGSSVSRILAECWNRLKNNL